MKKQIKRWTLRIIVSALFIVTLLLVIILNPMLTYANKTVHGNFSVYHNQPLDNDFLHELDEAAELLKGSEFYNPNLQLDICLNDGSYYPKIISSIRGQAFAWGFYDKVVMQGEANYEDNYVELNGYKWNLTQLIAHEMIHCLQFNKLGLRKSNPIAKIPDWKWEGYAEYIARQNTEQKKLAKNLQLLSSTNKTEWAITFSDSTIVPREYFDYFTLVQYCMDIKKMTYQQVLDDATQEAIVRQEIMNWYKQLSNL